MSNRGYAGRSHAKNVLVSAAAMVTAIIFSLVGVQSAVAGGSDDPTPYSVTAEGVTLPDGVTFKDGGHVNYRWKTASGEVKSGGVHFESLNNQPSGKYIGKSFYPWNLNPGDCIIWVQVAEYNEHFGEGGQAPVCVPPEKKTPDVVPTPDPTPVTTPYVSVGDYVWVDEGDGLQTDNDIPLSGVVLRIYGPDGNPAVDTSGETVLPQTTDADGHYLFEYLPVLSEGQYYTVTIDKEASADVLAPYVTTKSNVGARSVDSSDWSAVTQGLTNGGDSDLTLDFGFILKPKIDDVVDPEDPQSGDTDDSQSEDPEVPNKPIDNGEDPDSSQSGEVPVDQQSQDGGQSSDGSDSTKSTTNSSTTKAADSGKSKTLAKTGMDFLVPFAAGGILLAGVSLLLAKSKRV